MNAQLSLLHPSDPRAVVARARNTDPLTSHLAAAAVSPGCKDCIAAIRQVLTDSGNPRGLTAFTIAYFVELDHPDRWDEGTIRRRVKDAGLTEVKKMGKSPRGRACSRWTL